MDLPAGLLDLLSRPSPCFVATLMPDGSPQMTQTWVDDDAGLIGIHTVAGSQKVRTVERDPRIALDVADPADPSRYSAVRGRVVGLTAEVVGYLERGTRLAVEDSQVDATPVEHAPAPRWGWGVPPPYVP